MLVGNDIIEEKEGTDMAKKTTTTGAGATGAEDGKKQALELAIAQITKQFGDGSIMKLGETQKIDVELLPSGSLSLDLALGSVFRGLIRRIDIGFFKFKTDIYLLLRFDSRKITNIVG